MKGQNAVVAVSYLKSRVPMSQPFQFLRKTPATGRGRWLGGPSSSRRFDDRRSAYPGDREGTAPQLIALLYHGPRSTALENKRGDWFEKGLACEYHQGARVFGIGLNEGERFQRRKDLGKIKGQLDGMRRG